MTNIVFANEGTLDKYMGDAVMAFCPHSISRSCPSRLPLRLQVLKLFKDENLLKFLIPRFAGATSISELELTPVTWAWEIVRCGAKLYGYGWCRKLGSSWGNHKEYGLNCCQQFTAQVKDKFTLRELDWVKVRNSNQLYFWTDLRRSLIEKGKMLELFAKVSTVPVKIWGGKSWISKALRQAWRSSIKIYVDWCDDFISEPPPENWDGVKTMKTEVWTNIFIHFLVSHFCPSRGFGHNLWTTLLKQVQLKQV